MYRQPVFITLAETDAAGIIYFAELLRLAHGVWEQYLATQQIDLLHIDHAALPIVHCEAQYKRPIRRADTLICSISCKQLRRSSFEMGYTFDRADEVVATASIVHAAVDRDTFKSCPLPDILVAALKQLA